MKDTALVACTRYPKQRKARAHFCDIFKSEKSLLCNEDNKIDNFSKKNEAIFQNSYSKNMPREVQNKSKVSLWNYPKQGPTITT